MSDASSFSSPSPAEQVQLLFVRHQPVVRAYICSLLPGLSEADDVLQETFLTVTRKAATFEPGSNFLAWACSIARLKVLEQHRKNRRVQDVSEAALVALMNAAPEPGQMEQRERALRRCLGKLAPKARDLIWRRYAARESSEEMADALQMTSLAVRLVLTKARAALRDCVQTELHRAES